MAGKFWREAASLMVVGRAANLNSKVASRDFEVLLLKRSQKSSFFANSYVFPGGVTEPADFSESWMDVFEKCGYKSSNLETEFRSKSPLPPIFNKSYPILSEVGFRIGAIREAFEECGLLLAQDFPFRDLSKHQLSEWQHAVHKDGSQFLKMFQELGGCPAIRNLYEWTTWLTPARRLARRFDTAFFITFMDKIPPIIVDNKEIVDIKALTPQETLQQFGRQTLHLPPPQIYELGRLLNFDSYEDLEKFARERNKKGMEQLFPTVIMASDGVITTLPGDDLYPEEPDYNGEGEPIVTPETMEELRRQVKNLHRMEMKPGNDVNIIINISPRYCHVAPNVNSMKLLKNKL